MATLGHGSSEGSKHLDAFNFFDSSREMFHKALYLTLGILLKKNKNIPSSPLTLLVWFACESHMPTQALGSSLRVGSLLPAPRLLACWLWSISGLLTFFE